MKKMVSRSFQTILAISNFVITRIIVMFIPLKKNTFFCISMNGNSYGDNIKCLSDYINDHHKDAIIVWAFSDTFYRQVECEHIKVKLFSFAYYYHILTAKYILNNVGFKIWQYRKRKGQIVLNTWHGTALKKIGKDSYKKVGGNFLYKILDYDYYIDNAKMTDIFVSGSSFMSRLYRDALLQKNIYEIGTPRNDLFYQKRPDIINHVKEQYQIHRDSLILLYAPTFRTDLSVNYYDIDLKILKEVIEDRTKKNVTILVKWHPKFVEHMDIVENIIPPGTVDVTLHPDMQELLYASDYLVTDYSSSFFDYMYSGRPVILYVPDKDSYDRGFYFDIDKLPFIIINNNSEIKDKLLAFDRNDYNKKLDLFIRDIGSVEKGTATESAYNLLMKVGDNM